MKAYKKPGQAGGAPPPPNVGDRMRQHEPSNAIASAQKRSTEETVKLYKVARKLVTMYREMNQLKKYLDDNNRQDTVEFHEARLRFHDFMDFLKERGEKLREICANLIDPANEAHMRAVEQMDFHDGLTDEEIEENLAKINYDISVWAVAAYDAGEALEEVIALAWLWLREVRDVLKLTKKRFKPANHDEKAKKQKMRSTKNELQDAVFILKLLIMALKRLLKDLKKVKPAGTPLPHAANEPESGNPEVVVHFGPADTAH